MIDRIETILSPLLLLFIFIFVFKLFLHSRDNKKNRLYWLVLLGGALLFLLDGTRSYFVYGDFEISSGYAGVSLLINNLSRFSVYALLPLSLILYLKTRDRILMMAIIVTVLSILTYKIYHHTETNHPMLYLIQYFLVDDDIIDVSVTFIGGAIIYLLIQSEQKVIKYLFNIAYALTLVWLIIECGDGDIFTLDVVWLKYEGLFQLCALSIYLVMFIFMDCHKKTKIQ